MAIGGAAGEAAVRARGVREAKVGGVKAADVHLATRTVVPEAECESKRHM